MTRLTCFLQETFSLHYEDVDIFFLKELSICKISNNWQNLVDHFCQAQPHSLKEAICFYQARQYTSGKLKNIVNSSAYEMTLQHYLDTNFFSDFSFQDITLRHRVSFCWVQFTIVFGVGYLWRGCVEFIVCLLYASISYSQAEGFVPRIQILDITKRVSRFID